MWQQAVAICVFILFEINDHLTQSADFDVKGLNDRSLND